MSQPDGTESKSHQSPILQPQVLAELGFFFVTLLRNVILKASQTCKCLWVVLTSDSSMGKHPGIVPGASFYPPGSEAPAQQERCGNVGKPLYYFKSRLL